LNSFVFTASFSVSLAGGNLRENSVKTLYITIYIYEAFMRPGYALSWNVSRGSLQSVHKKMQGYAIIAWPLPFISFLIIICISFDAVQPGLWKALNELRINNKEMECIMNSTSYEVIFNSSL
jgi:hypothetical protein